MSEKTINIDNVKTLLNEVGAFLKAEQKLRKTTGQRYNLFNIIGVQKSELKHSLIIGDLLNPKGRHDQGDLYLKLFLDILKIRIKNAVENDVELEKNDFHEKAISIIDSFYSKHTKIHIEYFIGNKDGLEGGRIDVLLKSNEYSIVIENKVDAQDQKFQLLRYKNFVKDKGVVFYLTKFGNPPDNEKVRTSTYYKTNEIIDEKMKGEKYFHLDYNKDFFTISFKNEIIEWINKCKEISIDRPYIRENLSQYLDVIKKITKQLNSSIMNKELTEYFEKHPSEIVEAMALANYLNRNETYENLIGQKVLQIFNEITKDLDAELLDTVEEDWLKYNCKNQRIATFLFNDLKYFTISFKIKSNKDYNGFMFSLRKNISVNQDLSGLRIENNLPLVDLLQNNFAIEKIDANNLKAHKYNFIFHKDIHETMGEFSNLQSGKAMEAILNGSFKSKLKDEILRIKEILKSVEKEIL